MTRYSDLGCPGNPSHGRLLDVSSLEYAYYCPHSDHAGRAGNHPLGAAPATRAFFRLDEVHPQRSLNQAATASAGDLGLPTGTTGDPEPLLRTPARPATRPGPNDLAGSGELSSRDESARTGSPVQVQETPSYGAASWSPPPVGGDPVTTDPTTSAAASAHRLLAPALDARPNSISASDRSDQTLGLL